jgi:hypothetical protein
MSFRSVRWAVVAFTLVSLALPVGAAEKYGNSLDWVPANVAVYSSRLRFKEQIDIVAASNAWQKFRSIPSVAQAWQMVEAQVNDPNGPAAMALQLMQLPENQQLLQMLGDMFSEEVLVYGGPKVADCIELFQLINAAQQQGTLKAARAARDGDVEGSRGDQARAIVNALQENKELLKTPDFVMAFKLVDQQAAKTQLKRLEVLAQIVLQQSPIPDRFKREKIGDAEFLTLKLDGSLIPWDQVPWDQVEEEEGEFEELRETLEKLTLVISLGVRNDYLIFSIDESTDHLAKLGKGPALSGVKEFAPLDKFRDRKLVGLAYVSDAFAKKVQMNSADVDRMVEQVGGVLDAVGVEDAELKDRIASDIEKVGDDLKKVLPKPGAVMGFSFITPTGFEGYSYNWTEHKMLDGSKPLPLANHLGGDPVLAVVSRSKHDPQTYDTLVKWLKVGNGYFEEFAIPQMGGDDREKVTKAMEIAKPLLARADKTTRERLVPALKDGQGAFVLDAQISSKQWHAEMPESDDSLPMAELALVMGVSDAKSFKQAMSEYKAIADDLVKKIREIDPKAIPADYQVPSPTSESTQGGTVYTYKLPADAGLDAQIAPSGGVSEDVAVFSTSPRLAARVLADTPLKSQGLIGSASGKPCATLIFFNWSGLVEAITPWVDFAIRQNIDEEDEDRVADIVSQVRTGLEILQCWRTTEVVTTVDNGVMISHSVTTFKDVE